MGLMDMRVKTPNRQRKIHGINVVKKMASKYPTRYPNRANQKRQ
jgi:hypothetical protein